MQEIINSLYGNLEISNDCQAMIITILFVFIISVTVDIIEMLRGLGKQVLTLASPYGGII